MLRRLPRFGAVAALASAGPFPQTVALRSGSADARRRIVGSCESRSYELEISDGSERAFPGSRPNGYLVFVLTAE